MSRFLFAFCLLCSVARVTVAEVPSFKDSSPQRYHLTKRASQIDPRAKEYPEIDFRFTDKEGKAQDLQHAVVDTRVSSGGRLVIWLMGYNAPLFERTGDYGLH